MQLEGAYSARRAAALSGVPLRTVHHWARERLVVPEVSQTRTKLWSYRDLMLLRMLHWLRHKKPTAGGGKMIRATSMRAVKELIRTLAQLDVPLWGDDGCPVRVDRAGKVYYSTPGGKTFDREQVVEEELLDLVAPFEIERGLRGPNLVQPRPHLRIVPGKLSGAPHVEGTRVETEAISALARRGYELRDIVEFYPFVTRSALKEAIELEDQLVTNEVRAAA